MQSILEELYSGNIRPDSRIYTPDSPFVKAAHVKKESMDKLMDTMNEVQKELFEAYTDAQSEIEGITRYIYLQLYTRLVANDGNFRRTGGTVEMSKIYQIRPLSWLYFPKGA